MYMKKILSLALIVSLTATMIITQTGCEKKVDPVTKTSYYFDTVCQITIYDMDGMSEETAGTAISKAFKLCSTYENLLSKTKEGTDIYKINHAGGQPVKCDPRTIEVIKKGIYYGDLSGGKFDITIGKVTDLWNFEAADPAVPAAADIKAALADVDYKQIKISGNTVTMSNPAGEIDLGGIAKGFIADKVCAYMEDKLGVTSAIVSLGGNVEVIGDKAGTPFSVGIEKPYSEMSSMVGSVELSNATAVTSGIYERYFKINGKIYHHILNVNTGYPVDSDIVGVTILAAKGKSVDCDGLSTICLILGVDKATKLIESIDGIEAVFIDKDNNITTTSGVDKYNFKKS